MTTFVLVILTFTTLIEIQHGLPENNKSKNPYFDLFFKSVPVNLVEQQPSTIFIHRGQAYPRVNYFGIQLDMPIPRILSAAQQCVDLVNTTLTKKPHLTINHSMNNFDNSTNVNQSNIHRGFHLLELKAHRVQHLISAIKYDVKFSPAPFSYTRQKRELHIEVNPTSMISAFFEGLENVFYGHNIHKLEESIKFLAHRTSKLENFLISYSRKSKYVMYRLSQDMQSANQKLQMESHLLILLTDIEQQLINIQDALPQLLQGNIPNLLLDNRIAEQSLKAVSDKAAKVGLIPVIKFPLQLFQLPVTAFSTSQNWHLIIHTPIVDPRQTFQSYDFHNFPTLTPQNLPIKWNLQDSMLAVQPGLYPNIKYMLLPLSDIPSLCEEYFGKLTCHLPILHEPTCIMALFHNTTYKCQTTSASPYFMETFQADLVVLFMNQTQLLIQCGSNNTELHLHGLFKINNTPGCRIITENFEFYTRGHRSSNVVKMTENQQLYLSENLIQSVFQAQIEMDNITDFLQEDLLMNPNKNFSGLGLIPEFDDEENRTIPIPPLQHENVTRKHQRGQDYFIPSKKISPSKWDVIALVVSALAIFGTIVMVIWFIKGCVRLS